MNMPLLELIKRAGNNAENSRGIVGFEEKGWDGLFAERVPLLCAAAHYTIQDTNQSPEEMAESILNKNVLSLTNADLTRTHADEFRNSR